MTSNVRKNFQRNLNKFLQANKMNQVDLGAKLGVSQKASRRRRIGLSHI